MKTRSKTTGAPPASCEMRSDSNAASPARHPRSRASRRPRRTAETVSCARTMTTPSLNSRTWCSGVRARSARTTSSPVRGGEPRPQEPRRDVLALGREIPGEAAQLEDVVVDRGRSDERPETVAARDEVLALEELERLAQRHERHGEALRELTLIVEPRAGRERAAPDPFAQRLGDAVVAWDPTDALRVRRDTVHGTSVF